MNIIPLRGSFISITIACAIGAPFSSTTIPDTRYAGAD